MTEQAVNYNDLITGYEFPPATFLIDSELADTYASAVGDTNSLYKDINAVPPTAAFAFAMTALSRGISLPAGAIHVSQDMEFSAMIHPGDSITSRAKITRNQKRGQLHMLSIGLQLFNQYNDLVAAGSTDFILPPPGSTSIGK
jgi:hypothetical protein